MSQLQLAKPKAKTPKVPTLFHTGHLYMIAETSWGGHRISLSGRLRLGLLNTTALS